METVIKELPKFRLKIKKNPCLRPEDLNILEFVQENLNDKGEIDYTSTYQFFMTQDEINDLTKALTA
jgi:hypothetical protein